MIKFLIDTQLPPLLAEFFRYKGYDAKHTSEYPEGIQMSDKQIADYCIKEKRIVVSKDSDFIDMIFLTISDIRLLLIKTGNISNNELLKIISNRLDKIIELFSEETKIVIIYKNNILTY